jgi:hypothetical protein
VACAKCLASSLAPRRPRDLPTTGPLLLLHAAATLATAILPALRHCRCPACHGVPTCLPACPAAQAQQRYRAKRKAQFEDLQLKVQALSSDAADALVSLAEQAHAPAHGTPGGSASISSISSASIQQAGQQQGQVACLPRCALFFSCLGTCRSPAAPYQPAPAAPAARLLPPACVPLCSVSARRMTGYGLRWPD